MGRAELWVSDVKQGVPALELGKKLARILATLVHSRYNAKATGINVNP